MILIGQEIIDDLKAHVFSVPGISFSDVYSVSTPKCPQGTLEERPGNDGAHIDGMPCVVRNLFTVEVYAKDMMINGKPTPKRNAAILILQEIDQFLNEHFRLTMIGNINQAPYSDQTIFRAAANYVAYIDKRTNNIYRRF